MSAEQSTNEQSEEPTKSTPQEPVRCLAGCGFFGNPEYNNYCSVCFKKALNQSAPSAPAAPGGSTQPAPSASVAESKTDDPMDAVPTSEPSSAPQAAAPKKKKQKANRCYQCNKKIPLAGRFACKCGYTFCSMHRHADTHDCTFDWAAKHKQVLESRNPVVQASKLDKI